MKILIYGFKPYDDYRENITEKVIKGIKNRKSLTKVIFPVKFEKKIFLEKIKSVKPNVILGLGQCPGGKKIRIERKIANLKRQNKREKAVAIDKNEPRYQFVTLRLKKDPHSYLSYNAGGYVCNFSMHAIYDYCKGRNIKFAFLHIPYNFNVNKAIQFIEFQVDSIEKML